MKELLAGDTESIRDNRWSQVERADLEPPIMHVSGAGFTARLWMEGGRAQELSRKHLRRKYVEGVQVAFVYFECDDVRRAELMRLRKGFMR